MRPAAWVSTWTYTTRLTPRPAGRTLADARPIADPQPHKETGGAERAAPPRPGTRMSISFDIEDRLSDPFGGTTPPPRRDPPNSGPETRPGGPRPRGRRQGSSAMGDGGGRASQNRDAISGGVRGAGAPPPPRPAGGADPSMRAIENLLALVANPDRESTFDAPPAERSDALIRALLDPDPDRWRGVAATLTATGADPEALFEAVVVAARALGQMWLDDRVSFAEVTIACAALQALLREASPEASATPDAPLVAVAVRAGETHTLGAAMAAARLRRAGASVMLLVGRPDAELVDAVRGGDLSAVCLSASSDADLPAIARLVGRLREASGAPVLLGGAVLDGADAAALRRATGADRVTMEPCEALRPMAPPRAAP